MENKFAIEFNSDAVLKDGSLVNVRPVTPEDRSLLLDFLGNLSPESLVYRFAGAHVSNEEIIEKLLPAPDRFALLAQREGKVVGHAAYYLISPGKAEAALVVSDSFQGRGLGTILMGQLAEAGAASGVTVFEAVVSSENTKMLEVLRSLGLKTDLKVEPGLIRATFPTSLSPTALDAFERREAVASTAALEAFFRPKSIAVIGASRDPDTIGGALFHNIMEAGFSGTVYPVNVNADIVQSVQAYHSVLDCPESIDLALIAVPARYVVGVAKECAQKGAKGLVVITSGFSEVGNEGAELQKELSKVCKDSGMRLIGPNCMGIANTDPAVRLNAQFSPQKPREGNLGFLTQSGALGIAVIDYINSLGLGLSAFVSVGNKADISANDLIQFWDSDDRTSVILLYLESFGNPRKFSRIAKRVANKKPIIAVKSGRSSAGFRATQSHTGAMVAASDVTVEALFHQAGVVRTDTLSEMFDAAALLSTQPVPAGNRVAIITNAGGAGILAADACESLGLKVPELGLSTQESLRTFLKEEASVRNPVDMIASATAEDYAKAILMVAKDPSVDSMIVIFIPPASIEPESVARSVLSSVKQLGGRLPVLTCFMATHGISGLLTGDGIRLPSYRFPEDAANALAHAVRYGVWRSRPPGTPVTFTDTNKSEAAAIVARALKSGKSWLAPEDAESVLGCYKIPFVRTYRVTTPEEVGRAAKELGGKVVVKAVAAKLLHKTEAGAVALNLNGQDEAVMAARNMIDKVASAGFEVTGYLVQPMIPSGLEMLVGIVYDPLFGPAVACGAGGVTTELLRDFAIKLTPLTESDVDEMLGSLRTYPLFNGYRGGPIYDVKAFRELVLRVGALVEDIPEIAELDLNPVLVLANGEGVRVVDARIRVAEAVPPLPVGAKKR
jgi:acetyl coenzyme A synthetase (ADP forming)-like protein